MLILGKRRLHLFLANRVDLEACAVDHDGFRAPSNRTRGVAARRRRHASAHHCLPAVFPHGVFPIRSQAPVTKIVQGWPKLWANFRALIGIFNQSVGPGLAIWANPVEFSSVPCGGGRQADGRRVSASAQCSGAYVRAAVARVRRHSHAGRAAQLCRAALLAAVPQMLQRCVGRGVAGIRAHTPT